MSIVGFLRSHIKIPEDTQSLDHQVLGKNYFEQKRIPQEEKIARIIQKANNLSKIDEYGYATYSKNNTLCYQSIEILMDGSNEKENRKEILYKEVLNKDIFHNCLSVGVGNGEMTMYISDYCTELTVIDNDPKQLENVPNYFGQNKKPVTKIFGSILDIELTAHSETCYDFIDYLHAIYPLKNQQRLPVIDKLLNSACNGGKLVVAYNSGLKRDELLDTFNEQTNDLDGFAFKVLSNKKYNAYGLSSIEIIKSPSIEPIVNVAGVYLYDDHITVHRDNLTSWLEYNAYDGHNFQLDSYQNFLIFEA